MMLDTGTVQELFQKDINKARSDSEDDFEKYLLEEENTLHTSCSAINIKTESLYDDGTYINITSLPDSEEGYTADDYDRENKTRFGLETIVEEMHDQSEEVIAESNTALRAPKSDLIYEEYEIDLGGQTSEELHRSEEFQRLLSLLSKPKNVYDSPTAVASDASTGDNAPNILIETTTNRKVECTLKEVKNTKYYLKGDGGMGSGINLAEEVPSEGDCKIFEDKGAHNPPDHRQIEHPGKSEPKCIAHETTPSKQGKPKKSSGKPNSGKSEKRHGGPPGSKKTSKSVNKRRRGWVENVNLNNVACMIWDKVKDFSVLLQPQAGPSCTLLSAIGDAVLKALNLRNAFASIISFLIMLILIGVVFYKPPGVFDVVLHRFGRRRSPLQAFYDTLLSLLHGIIM